MQSAFAVVAVRLGARWEGLRPEPVIEQVSFVHVGRSSQDHEFWPSMDTLESLGKQLSQITMYDVKSVYNQAKNIVLNVSEMEAKVREATNDDPWGASSTLMNEIAQGTFNYQQFNEIMPCIYSRFMEKEARQWRQIYKALQLLEFLIKNGSERTVDDARSHIGTIKMLRNFHYIDDKGKDQGINVRNRSREIVELLGDLDKVRTERKKAKMNKNKYTGTGNDGLSFSSGGSRYGGFGSDSLGDGGGWSGGGVSSTSDFYSTGGGFQSSSSSSGFRDSVGRRQEYDEYDPGEDDLRQPHRTSSAPPRRSGSTRIAAEPARASSTRPAPAPAPAPAPVVDLLGGFDDPIPAPAPAVDKALPVPSSVSLDDDDFGGFESAPAPPAAAPVAKPAAPAPAVGGNVFDVLGGFGGGSAPAPAPAIAPASMHRPTDSLSMGSFGGLSPQQPQSMISPRNVMPASPPPLQATRPGLTPAVSSTSTTSKGAANFDDLWNMSLGGSAASSAAKPATAVKSMKDLEKEKAQTAIWGGGVSQKPSQSQWGNFGGSTSTSSAAGGGGDDLLL